MNNRSGRRGQHHRHRRPLQIDEEVWTVNPLTDHHHLSPPCSPPSDDSSATATAPTIASVPTIGTRQNSGRVSKNRRARRPKPMSVNKSEVGSLNSLDSQLGSLSIAEKVNEKEEEKEEDRTEVSESSEGVDGVLSRWEELQLGVQEPELSEQQLRINDQLQEDELSRWLYAGQPSCTWMTFLVLNDTMDKLEIV
nr:hypothetical protein CFP56_26255 [Quercus suber]